MFHFYNCAFYFYFSRSYIDGSIVTSHLWQIFVAKDIANQFPSTQYLLESSFLQLGFLEEVPFRVQKQVLHNQRSKTGLALSKMLRMPLLAKICIYGNGLR